MLKEVLVVDYGRGNLLSVCRALEAAGAAPEITADPERIRKADRVVLPGVGAFGDAMAGLDRLGLSEAIIGFSGSGRPLLGICLGMQLLMDLSSEFGTHAGLRLIRGSVERLPQDAVTARPKIPNVGWSRLDLPLDRDWTSGLLARIRPGDYCYFVHSFHAVPLDPADIMATIRFGDRDVAAVIRRDNYSGCQFHPEKSAAVGRRILEGWLNDTV